MPLLESYKNIYWILGGLAQSSLTLKKILKNLKNNIKNDVSKKIIIFSPSAASFDQFKNFEERGKFFNKNIKYIIREVRT